MFLGLIDTTTPPIVVMGLTDLELCSLSNERLASFNLSDLGLASKWVVVTRADDDGLFNVPTGFSGLVLAITDSSIAAMRRGRPVEDGDDDIRVVAFSEPTHIAIEEKLQAIGLIGPETKQQVRKLFGYGTQFSEN